MTDKRLELVQSKIRDIPDFPKPGILFKDITPLLAHPEGFAAAVDLLAERTRGLEPDIVAAPEARGFIFGVPLAQRLGVGFAPVRKQGKLPWKTIRQSYSLEYGEDTVEMHEDALTAGHRVLLVDDLLATGGTMAACCALAEQTGATVAGCAFVIELGFLDGRSRLGGRTVRSLIEF